MKAWDGKAVAAPAPTPKKAESDDEMDLFGEDNEADEKAANEAKAKIAAAKTQ